MLASILREGRVRRPGGYEIMAECSAQILAWMWVSCSRWKLFNTYPHRTSTLQVLAISSVRCSTCTAASTLPCAHNVGESSPQAATRECSPVAILATEESRSPKTLQESVRVRQIIHHEC